MNSKDNLIDLLKKEMGYSENSRQCLNCKHCPGKNISGDLGSCNLNPAFTISINIYGTCSHWKMNEKSNLTNDPFIKKPINGPDRIPNVDLIKS